MLLPGITFTPRSRSISQLIRRPKKLIVCFPGTARFTYEPPHQKIFIVFPVITLKNLLHIVNCKFREAVICRQPATLFVDWLVRILKVEHISGNYS